MISFQVSDMTCGHCVNSITKAVHAADSNAKVQIELASHRVQIMPGNASAAQLGDAIRQAGYTPLLIEPMAAGA